MRITSRQVASTVLRHVQEPQRRLAELSEKLSSGKEINRFSDDPVHAGRVQKIAGQQASAAQYQRNVENGLAWMRHTEAAIERLESNIIRAKELAIQGANGSQDADSRQKIAVEVNQILEDTLAISNSQFNSKYLFAGKNTTDRPFVETRTLGDISSVAVAADASGEITREVGENTYVAVNADGDALFDLSTGPFAALMGLRDALEANDGKAVAASIDEVSAVLETSLDIRAGLGARMSRLEVTRDHLTTLEVELAQSRSGFEDADLAELAIEMNLADVSQRAALSATARIVQTSLVDLLT